MRGLEKNRMKRGQTNRQTNTHRDSMKASAQRADALKNIIRLTLVLYIPPPPPRKHVISRKFKLGRETRRKITHQPKNNNIFTK